MEILSVGDKKEKRKIKNTTRKKKIKIFLKKKKKKKKKGSIFQGYKKLPLPEVYSMEVIWIVNKNLMYSDAHHSM